MAFIIKHLNFWFVCSWPRYAPLQQPLSLDQPVIGIIGRQQDPPAGCGFHGTSIVDLSRVRCNPDRQRHRQIRELTSGSQVTVPTCRQHRQTPRHGPVRGCSHLPSIQAAGPAVTFPAAWLPINSLSIFKPVEVISNGLNSVIRSAFREGSLFPSAWIPPPLIQTDKDHAPHPPPAAPARRHRAGCSAHVSRTPVRRKS